MAVNDIQTAGNTFLDEDFFEDTVNQIVEALVVINPDFTIKYANQPFLDLFGYESDEIIGKSIHKLGVDEELANLKTPEIAEILHQKEQWHGEVLRRSKSGHYIPVLVNARAIYNDHGEFAGFIGTYQDLRKIRKSELKLKHGLTKSLIALGKAIEDREVFKKRHQNRVNELCVAIALELGMDTFFIEGLSLAAMLHDIGKIYIPSEVLNYSGILTEHERKLMRTHPTIAYEILKDIDLPWPIADIILQHHERIDGSGYPNKLKGDEILIGARILAVADVVDNMHSARSYRSGYDWETCLSELEIRKGVWYDTTVVDACLKIIKEGRYSAALE